MKLTLTVADVVKVDVKDFVKELRVELSERQENILELIRLRGGFPWMPHRTEAYHPNIFISLYMKKGRSATPLTWKRNPFILEFSDSADALVDRLVK